MMWGRYWEWDWWSRDGQLRVHTSIDLGTWLIGFASGERDLVVSLLCLSITFENWENPPDNWKPE